MQSLHNVATEIGSEIEQKKILQKNLVLKILSSKRLLIDHIEAIEDSLNDLLIEEKPPKNLITFLGTSSVLATSFVVFVCWKQKYLIPFVSGVIPILYLQKLVNVKRRESLEAKLSKFINSLNNYESAIKKNKTFLQEAQMIKSSTNILKRYDRENKMPHNLLGSIKNVIDALYTFVKDLEMYAITEKLSHYYEPFEDIQDCDLMTMSLNGELDLKIIKDFFNIFAYVQSQVLLRFALITVSNVEDCKTIINKKIDVLTDTIRAESSNISKFLNLIDNVSQLQANIRKQIDKEISVTLPKELREVRTGSIKFSAKILTVAMQCQQLEELIVSFAEKFEHPDDKEIEEILAVMKTVENEMSVSIDEHKRIAISFQKYLNMEFEDAKTTQETLDGAGGDNTIIVKKLTEDDVAVQADDFFFVNGNPTEAEDETKEQQPETIEEVNSKLAKKYFKPVLVQLKERIEVIGEDMKEREKKVLKAKGIEIQDEPEEPKIPSHFDLEGSGSDDEGERQRKIKKSQQKFHGNREFLEAKQPINIFAGAFPPGFPSALKGQALDEDVLE